MSKRRQSDHVLDIYASNLHRNTGDRNYLTDLDGIAYSYENGRPKPKAFFENKYGKVTEINLQDSSIQVLKAMADQLSLPFFLCITYVDPTYFDAPMYYLEPLNKLASSYPTGWMTLRQFSKLGHQIRDVVWNKYEWIAELQCMLGELSDIHVEYELPAIKNRSGR